MLASSADNIRYNGTGIGYAGTVGSGNPGVDMGELEGFSFNQSVSKSSVNSTRNAARAKIIEAVDSTEATLKWGLREQTEENLKMVLMASAIASNNQLAGTIDQDVPTWVDDQYIDLGKLNCFSTKIAHGAVTGGPFQVGETITGGTSSATGKVAYVAASYVEIVSLSGTFQAGETITGGTSGATAAVSGITTQQDVVVTSADGATRRVQGTDYTVVPKSGFVRKLSTGGITATDVVSCDHPALTVKTVHGLSSSTVERKVTFDTDPDDKGPRKRYTFHRVNVSADGDMILLGDGTEVLNVSGTVIKDTTQPSGQEYYRVDVIS